jgi:hypothetical protein
VQCSQGTNSGIGDCPCEDDNVSLDIYWFRRQNLTTALRKLNPHFEALWQTFLISRPKPCAWDGPSTVGRRQSVGPPFSERPARLNPSRCLRRNRAATGATYADLSTGNALRPTTFPLTIFAAAAVAPSEGSPVSANARQPKTSADTRGTHRHGAPAHCRSGTARSQSLPPPHNAHTAPCLRSSCASSAVCLVRSWCGSGKQSAFRRTPLDNSCRTLPSGPATQLGDCGGLGRPGPEEANFQISVLLSEYGDQIAGQGRTGDAGVFVR